ncbi:dephospho-CoA kinase [bacterium]|nr:dephospho-CoA kinase [bacterium]
MKILVTGIVASGKTFFSTHLSNCLSYKLISADNIAMEIREKEKIKKNIISQLKLNENTDMKVQLANILKIENKRKRLDNILHPLIKDEINNLLDANDNIIIDCPIPKSLGIIGLFDLIVIVRARKRTLFRRMKRLNFDKKTKRLLYKIQKKEINSIIADHYITNNGVKNIEKVVIPLCNIIKSFN